jgi:hypothetical protein
MALSLLEASWRPDPELTQIADTVHSIYSLAKPNTISQVNSESENPLIA